MICKADATIRGAQTHKISSHSSQDSSGSSRLSSDLAPAA
jgi:hypothetical protein